MRLRRLGVGGWELGIESIGLGLWALSSRVQDLILRLGNRVLGFRVGSGGLLFTFWGNHAPGVENVGGGRGGWKGRVQNGRYKGWCDV